MTHQKFKPFQLDEMNTIFLFKELNFGSRPVQHRQIRPGCQVPPFADKQRRSENRPSNIRIISTKHQKSLRTHLRMCGQKCKYWQMIQYQYSLDSIHEMLLVIVSTQRFQNGFGALINLKPLHYPPSTIWFSSICIRIISHLYLSNFEWIEVRGGGVTASHITITSLWKNKSQQHQLLYNINQYYTQFSGRYV